MSQTSLYARPQRPYTKHPSFVALTVTLTLTTLFSRVPRPPKTRSEGDESQAPHGPERKKSGIAASPK